MKHLLVGAIVLLTGCVTVDATLTSGYSVVGNLERSDVADPQQGAADRFTFIGRQGETYAVRLSSDVFDTYLTVIGPDGGRIENDDDGHSLDSRLSFTFTSDGVAQVLVSSFSGELGVYELSLQTDEAPPAAAPPQPIAIGDSVEADLSDADAQSPSGEFFDTYTLDGIAGEVVDIELSSSAFDSYLVVAGPDGFAEQNDDVSDLTLNSRLHLTLPSNGAYAIQTSSFAPWETGPYQLSVQRSLNGLANIADPSLSAALEAASAPHDIAYGQTLHGQLSLGSQTLPSGKFKTDYVFEGSEGDHIVVQLRSVSFDPFLILRGPPGRGAETDRSDRNDDISASDRNAAIEITLPVSGQYTISATSHQAAEIGDYDITLSRREVGEQISGPGRIFALTIGISDYPPPGENYPGDLKYVAGDPGALRDELVGQNALSDASIMLVDAAATRQAVTDAIAGLIAAAGPEDVLLFFFSGHGRQQPGRVSATEPDGLDETIALHDGPLLDDELAAMLDASRARLTLVVLDSCFGGGFDRDVVTRAGVMGMFASQEDLTSSTAAKYEAGGYLAVFLTWGLGGAADTDENNLITVGEISSYVQSAFREESRSSEHGQLPSHTRRRLGRGIDNEQVPVISRGGVPIDAVILALAPPEPD